MAENESAAVQEPQENQGAQEQQEPEFQYPIKIEDAGPAAKKVTVEIPADRISQKLAEQFKEIRAQAAIPGFRPGHAPQKLVEKRFSTDVKDQVRRSLITESFQQAVEQNKLEVIGEPKFDNPENIKLPESGPLSYSFQVEVQPDIKLPDLAGLKVKKPKILVTDASLDKAMLNLREQQGTLVPVEDRGVQAGDYLVADVHVKQDGNVVAHQHDAQVVARAGRIGGVQIDDLDKQLEGMKGGETRTLNATAPESHPNEQLRGKPVQIEVALKDIKRLEAAEVNAEFLQNFGFEKEEDLRQALREQMDQRIQFDIQQAMREQVNRYLLDNVQMDLPTKLSDRQADRVVNRRAVDLLMRGIPQDQVQANLDQLKSGAKDEASRELKLFFILQKVAGEMNVDVTEAELNGRVASLAAQRGQRPEKVKQEMDKDGTLANLYVQMREQKAVDKVLETAQVEEVEVPEGGESK